MTHFDSEKAHPQILTLLYEFLADTAVVYYKTHAFHWNLEDSNFYSVHLMLEKFYVDLWESMDEIAEHIRALGEKAPPSYTALLQKASLKEYEGFPATHVMIKSLREDYLALWKKAEKLGAFAEEHEDLVTVDVMTERAKFLSKAAWMLQSSSSA